MNLLTKVRGLWRFDGDEEPIAVSRRSFIFMGGVVTAGAFLPAIPWELDPEIAVSAVWRNLTPPPTMSPQECIRALKKKMAEAHRFDWHFDGEWLAPQEYWERVRKEGIGY